MAYGVRNLQPISNTELLDRLSAIASLDFLTRMESSTGKEMNDLYTRMVGAQQ